MKEIINRIPKHYVSKDLGCAQIMIPYVNTLSIFSKDGIVFNKVPNNQFINQYLENPNSKEFPYHNIPNHIRRQGLFGRINMTNQLLNFDEHYVTISDGIAIDRCVLLDKDEALILTKILPHNIQDNSEYENKQVKMNRDELDQMFKPSSESEKVYIATIDGTLYQGENIGYKDEEHFLKSQREKFQRQFTTCSGTMSDDTIEFIERKINEMTTDDLRNYPLPPAFYLIKINNTDIKIQLIYSEMIRSNEYKVMIKNIPLNKYVLEQFKYMAPNIVELKEPKISLRLNQGIVKEDITEAKKMVLSRKK